MEMEGRSPDFVLCLVECWEISKDFFLVEGLGEFCAKFGGDFWTSRSKKLGDVDNNYYYLLVPLVPKFSSKVRKPFPLRVSPCVGVVNNVLKLRKACICLFHDIFA